jgi:hypothetical protein
MTDEDLIREIATKAFNEALQARSQELAEDIAQRMKAALQPESAPRERTKALRDGSMLIAGSRTQTETLEALLAASSAVSDGCGLLILRGTQAGGWSCHGLTTLDNFKRAVLDCSGGVIAKAIASSTTAETRASELDPVFVARLRLDALTKVVLIPVLLKGRIAALLFALAPIGDEAAALELLVQVAQLVLDVQAYRKTAPKPAVEAHPHTAPEAAHSDEAPQSPPAPPEPAHVVAEATVAAESSEPAPSPVEAVVADKTSEPEPAVAEPSVPAAVADEVTEPPVVSAEPPAEPVHAEPRVATYLPRAEPEQIYLPAAKEPVPVAASVRPAPSLAPDTAYASVAAPEFVPEVYIPEQVAIPAPVVAPAFHEVAVAPLVSVPPDQAHEKARRFAKLLVEEIKLYNQSKVAEGRARGDLYSRLREDIEKSRAAYQKRYGETVRDVDYFSQELLRILADNNRSVMGAGFPG